MSDDRLNLIDDCLNLDTEVSKALSRVNTIKRKFTMYEPLSDSELKHLNKMFEEEEIFTSNHIEGNSYTLNETHYLLETGLAVNGKKLKDANEIINLKKAIDFIKGYRGTFTEDFIKEVHSIVTHNTLDHNYDEGNYKTVRNWVGNLNTSSPQATPKHMRELLEWFNSIELNENNVLKLAPEFKFRFIKIHPFIDGNGRVSRLLFNYIIKQFGFISVSILPEDKELYYKALINSDLSKTDELCVFMCNCLVKTYDRRISKLEY